jgi:hypothetical protein
VIREVDLPVAQGQIVTSARELMAREGIGSVFITLASPERTRPQRLP